MKLGQIDNILLRVGFANLTTYILTFTESFCYRKQSKKIISDKVNFRRKNYDLFNPKSGSDI